MLRERILRLIESPEQAEPGELERLAEAIEAAENATEFEEPADRDLDLAGVAIGKALAQALPGGRVPVLVLAPEASEGRDSEPDDAPLFDVVLQRNGSDQSLRAYSRRGVEVAKARSWLAARQRDRKPALVMGLVGAFSDLLATLARRHLHFRLPPGSTAVEVVGGSGSVPTAAESIRDGLAIPADRLFRVYAPAGTITPFMGTIAEPGGSLEFKAPPWTRARIIDPAGSEVEPGEAGRFVILDLARAGRGDVEVVTSDQGAETGEGFRLVGNS